MARLFLPQESDFFRLQFTVSKKYTLIKQSEFYNKEIKYIIFINEDCSIANKSIVCRHWSLISDLVTRAQ